MAFIFDRLSRDLSAETDNGLIDGVRQELVVYLETAARDTIINDILTLSGIIISIEDDFAIVASRLTMLDEKGVVSNKFAPAWERLHDEYTTLMRESQRGANSISNKIGTLVKDLIPVLKMPIPLNDKKGMLMEYIEDLQSFRLRAERNAFQFLRLGQAVTHFKDDLKQKVESRKEGASRKFEGVEMEIEKLESSLENFYHLEKECEDAMTTIWRFGDNEEIRCITSLVDIAPTVGREMMDIALRYLNSDLADDLTKLEGVDVVSTERALSNLKFMRDQRWQINTEFSPVLRSLLDLDPTFTGISNKISKIEGIWPLLVEDSQTLLNKLPDMNTTEYYEAVFNQFATILALTYEALQFGLDQYALVVSKSDVDVPRYHHPFES